MIRKAILRSNISFGLVSISVELYPATHSEAVHFNLLHAKDNSRIQEKIFCIAEGKQIERSELVHGFQISKGTYVSFSGQELKKLEASTSQQIEIAQFVPIAAVDQVYFVASYLLARGSGSAKAYQLLHAAMKKSARAAVASLVMRGKEHLALIRPYEDVLVLHTMHYANEIRSTSEIDSGRAKINASELRLAERLIDDLSQEEFDVTKFEDSYRSQILKLAKQKAAGHEIEVPTPPKASRTVDLMAALKRSLEVRPGTYAERNPSERARSERRGKSARQASHSAREAHRRKGASA
jgi:DNA end-binding protein Ku